MVYNTNGVKRCPESQVASLAGSRSGEISKVRAIIIGGALTKGRLCQRVIAPHRPLDKYYG